MCRKAKMIKWYFPIFQNAVFEGSKLREESELSYSLLSAPVQLNSLLSHPDTDEDGQRWCKKCKPLYYTHCTKRQCVRCCYEAVLLLPGIPCKKSIYLFCCGPFISLSLPSTASFISFPVASAPCLHGLLIPLLQDTQVDHLLHPRPRNQFFSPLFGHFPVSFFFSLISFPSFHSSHNETHRRLQKPVAAKEATVEASSDIPPLVAGGADEELSHSFRSYKKNQWRPLYQPEQEQNITHLLLLP